MEELKLIDLGEAIGEGALQAWKRGTPDPGVSFLSGSATSIFSNATGALDTAASGANIVANAGEIVTTVSNLKYNEYKNAIKNAAINIYEREVKDYAEQKFMYISKELVTASTTYFAARLAYWTVQSSKTSIAEFLMDMMGPVDVKRLNEANKQTTDEFYKQNAELKEKLGAITNVASSAIQTAEAGINETLTYIKAGPQFVETNLNKYLKLTITPAQKQIDKTADTLINDAYKASDSAAQKLGTMAGGKITEQTKRLAEKTKANVEKAKITVISFVKSALDLVQKKALALIGG